MRKVLALVLALAMVLGCFASVFAAEYTDVKADADYATAVSVLSDLGVVSGYTDGTYKPEKVVSRAEMAALLVKALGLTPAASATTNFSDVPATHWASGYVAYANTLGIIAGYTDGTFKPEKTVSYDEAITMIISALGYKAEALEGTTWPTAYVLKAQQLKITKGVDLLGSAGANRGDIAELLYNTLGCQLGKTNKDGEFVQNAKSPESDNMYDRLGAIAVTDCFVTDAIVDAAEIDLTEYLGAVIDGRKNDEGAIIAVENVDTTFVEGKLDTTKKTVGSTKYDTTDPTGLAAAKVFLNGANGGSVATGSTYKFAVKLNSKGVITEFVSAQYWNGTDIQITAADVKDFAAGKTTVHGYAFPKTEDEKAIDESEITFAGITALSEMKEDGIATIYVAAGTVVKVEYNDETVIGKITKISGDKATINGATYAKPASPDFKKEYIVYLNYAGEQFGATQEYSEAAYESEYAYGVVLAAGYSETTDTFDATVGTRQLKIVDATGAEVVLTVNKDANTGLLAQTGAAFKTSPSLVKGDFIQYKLNDKDELILVEKVTTVDGTSVVVKNNMVGTKAIASNVLVFVYDNTDMAKAKFTVADKIADAKYTVLNYVVNDKAQIAMIYVGPETGAGAGTTVYGIYTGTAQTANDKYALTFLVDGAEKEIESSTNPTFGEATGTLLTVTLTDGKYTSKATFGTAETKKEVTVTTKGSVTGNTFVANGGAFDAVLAADAVYYMVDGTKVTVSDQATMLKSGKVTLYDITKDGDNIFDIVVFVKPVE